MSIVLLHKLRFWELSKRSICSKIASKQYTALGFILLISALNKSPYRSVVEGAKKCQ